MPFNCEGLNSWDAKADTNSANLETFHCVAKQVALASMNIVHREYRALYCRVSHRLTIAVGSF